MSKRPCQESENKLESKKLKTLGSWSFPSWPSWFITSQKPSDTMETETKIPTLSQPADSMQTLVPSHPQFIEPLPIQKKPEQRSYSPMSLSRTSSVISGSSLSMSFAKKASSGFKIVDRNVIYYIFYD